MAAEATPEAMSEAPTRLMTDQLTGALGTIVLAARDGRLSSVDYLDCQSRMVALLAKRYGP
jgi:hypothetical protein